MKTLSGVSALLIILGATVPAIADVIPADVLECNNLALGAACSKGTCQNSSCTRLDYAHWDRDASSSPPSMSYACLRCLPTSGAGGATSSGVDAGSDAVGPTGSCSCGLVGRSMARIAPWLLAGVFWLPLLRRRRNLK